MTYGAKAEYVYDELDRVSEVWYTENSTGTQAYSYEYDANGNLYRFNDHASKRIHVYKYDLNGDIVHFVGDITGKYVGLYTGSQESYDYFSAWGEQKSAIKLLSIVNN